MSRPRVALLVTCYFAASHADVVGTRLLEGYEWDGRHVEPRVEVASFYLEQEGEGGSGRGRPDIGVAIAERSGVPRYPTIAEAIGCGRSGVNVDGVVIIGEHGDYEYNEFGQKLYPRRRFFDAAVSTMLGAGRTVPVFNDKHLAWSFSDARAIYDTARRLGIPLLAGSSVPLSWRIPTGAQWPLGEPMTDAVLAGYGPTEIYGFHNLEALQCQVERRAGRETGVASVRTLAGEAAVRATLDGTIDEALLDKALGTFDLDAPARDEARASTKAVFLLTYNDGLRAAVVNCDKVIGNWGVACRGPGHELACQFFLEGHPHGHFIFLVRAIEALMLDRVPPYPVERTLLTTGALDAAMRSQGQLRHTPELAIEYEPADEVADTGMALPLSWTGSKPPLEGAS